MKSESGRRINVYGAKYVGSERFFSYAHQLSTVVSLQPESVLEVGVGNRITCETLRLLGIRVTTLDLDGSLEPDLTASVLEIPAEDGSFDVAVCCQVLEHLPFSEVGPALAELKRVTRRGLVLSVPDQTRSLDFSFRIPSLDSKRFNIPVPFPLKTKLPAKHREWMGHHWELGVRGSELVNLNEKIQEAGWVTARRWRVPENPWHHFFLLEAVV